MHKLLLLLFLLCSVVLATEYPKTFSQLGTPLYKSVKPISKYSEIKLLQDKILTYEQLAGKAIIHGFEVDKSKDKKQTKEYLLELRKLQKSYDFILHLLHDNINTAIDKKDYELFLKLTNYEFEGLLQNSNLRTKSIKFYADYSGSKKSKVLENKIERNKLIEETTQEFYNQSVKSTYDPNSKDKDSAKSVYIKAKRSGSVIYVAFKNSNIYDVTVKVKSKYSNIIPSKNTPETFVLKANSTVEYTKLKMGVGKTSYQYGYSWIIGDKDAVHDDEYLYRLPFARGSSHVVSQGFNGERTHTGSSKYSIDFAMKEGTKVYASRDGVVVKIKSDSNKGGYSKEFAQYGNFVTIAHSDGTLGTYYHLKKGGVVVRIGDRVQRGYHIGYSGNTGYSSGPHLHFAVFKAISAAATHTIPVKFISQNGVVTEPNKGTSYKAK